MISKAVDDIRRRPALISAVILAGIDVAFWAWFFLQPDFRRENLPLEAGMGVFFVAMIGMGPGTLIFLLLASIYGVVYQAHLVGPMPTPFSNLLMLSCGLAGWAATGFVIASGWISFKTRSKVRTGKDKCAP